jgi:type IV secretion system protein VirD4
MPWDVLFACFKYAVRGGVWLVRWGVVAPLWTWPVLFWTRAWTLLRRQVWAALLLVPGLWVCALAWLAAGLGALSGGWLRPLAYPAAAFFRAELDAVSVAVLLPDWLVESPSALGRLLLLWSWAPLVGTLFASPVYLAVALAKQAALSPDALLDWGKKTASRAFGSAAFAGEDDGKGWLQRTQPGALVIGRHAKKRGRFYTVSGHVLTCAPTGAGKGIGCVLPNLSTYQGSIFCLDVKGENYLHSHVQRRAMGQAVWLVDPFGITGEPGVALDWLAPLRSGAEEAVSLAMGLAEAMVVRASGVEAYWDDAAVNLLQGLLLEAARIPYGQVELVRAWLTGPEADLEDRLRDVAAHPERSWGIPARAANGFLAKAPKERSGVLSTAQRHTAFLDDPRLARALSTGDAQQSVILQAFAAAPTTIFFALPPDKLVTYNRFARVSLTLLLQTLVARGLRRQVDTLLLLDEFAQLGYFPPIEEGLSMLRGYGVSIWCLVQDLSQLRAVYPKWRSFVANNHLQFFGTQDLETARYVSDLLGHKTVRVEHGGEARSWGQDQKASSSANESSSEVGRPLYTPDEVRRLPSDEVLLFERGQAARRLVRLDVTQQKQQRELAAFAGAGPAPRRHPSPEEKDHGQNPTARPAAAPKAARDTYPPHPAA